MPAIPQLPPLPSVISPRYNEWQTQLQLAHNEMLLLLESLDKVTYTYSRKEVLQPAVELRNRCQQGAESITSLLQAIQDTHDLTSKRNNERAKTTDQQVKEVLEEFQTVWVDVLIFICVWQPLSQFRIARE